MNDELNDEQFVEALSEANEKILAALRGVDIEVGMNALADILASTSKEVGMSEFQAINSFVSVVKQTYKEN